MDEMDIRKHVEWDRKRFSGFVNISTDTDDDSLTEATDTLVSLPAR